ncbi:MAG: HU family DNA-binding protein [Pseudomonadota bacterium]
MNAAELKKKIAEASGLTITQAGAALDALAVVIASELTSGGEVALIGVGKFGVAKREARIGRNPNTGQAVNIPAKTVIKFKASAAMKVNINK